MTGAGRGVRSGRGRKGTSTQAPPPTAGAGGEVGAPEAEREEEVVPLPIAAEVPADPGPTTLALRAYADLAALSPDDVAQLDPLGFWRRPSPTPGQLAVTRSVLAHLLRSVAREANPLPGETEADKTARWQRLAAALDSGDLTVARTAAQWLARHDQISLFRDHSTRDAQLSALALASWAKDERLPLVASLDLLFGLLPLTGRDVAQEFRDGLDGDEPPPPGLAEEQLQEIQLAEEALVRQVGRLRVMSYRSSDGQWQRMGVDALLGRLEADLLDQGHLPGRGDRQRDQIDQALLVAADTVKGRRDEAGRRQDAANARSEAGDGQQALGAALESRGPGSGAAADADASQTGLAVTPFPRFDRRRLNENRTVQGERYSVLAQPLPTAAVPPVAELRLALAALVEEMPNATAVLDLLLREVALLALGPVRPLTLPPLLLVGPPGVGKTRLARRIAEVLGLRFAWTSAAASSDTREMSGTARGWSSGHPAWPVEQLVTLRTANPLLLVDEVDKSSPNRRNGSMLDALLVYLERDTARVFQDEFIGGPVDLSHVSWVLTANDLEALPAPLRSRLHVARVEPPEPGALPAILATMRADLAAELDLPDPRLLPALNALQAATLEKDYARHRDPRRLKRALRSMLAFSAVSLVGEAN